MFSCEDVSSSDILDVRTAKFQGSASRSSDIEKLSAAIYCICFHSDISSVSVQQALSLRWLGLVGMLVLTLLILGASLQTIWFALGYHVIRILV